MEKQTVKERIVLIQNKLRVGKDGKNSYYEYFKPDDILKTLNPLLKEYNLITIFNLKNNGEFYTADLTIEDTESDQNVKYLFDIDKAVVKGANAAQNSGATLTYAKRYSLMNAFNLADNDADFDSNKKPNNPDEKNKNKDKSKDLKCVLSEVDKLVNDLVKTKKTETIAAIEKFNLSPEGVPSNNYKAIKNIEIANKILNELKLIKK